MIMWAGYQFAEQTLPLFCTVQEKNGPQNYLAGSDLSCFRTVARLQGLDDQAIDKRSDAQRIGSTFLIYVSL